MERLTIVSGKSFEGTLTVGFGGEYMEYRREICAWRFVSEVLC